MCKIEPTKAQQVANAAIALQLERTGHSPRAATVVFSDDTVVITLRGALSAAERAMASSPDGAAKVQEFHRQLFASSSEMIRREIMRITGVQVREAASEIEMDSGAVVHAFTSGTMVQVFLLAEGILGEMWKEGNGDQ